MKRFIQLAVASLAVASLMSCSSANKEGSAADGIVDVGTKKDGEPAIKSSTKLPPSEVGSAEARLADKYKSFQSAVRSQNASRVKEEASKLLSKDQKDVIVLNGLGNFYFNQGKHRAARYFYEQALESHPNEAGLYNNLALADLKEDDTDGALLNFKRAHKANPRHFETLMNMGSLYLANGIPERAVEFLKEAHRKEPSNVALANNLGVALRQTGDIKGAEAVLRPLVSGTTKDEDLMLNFSILLVEYANKPGEALPILNRLNFLVSDNETMLSRVQELDRKARRGTTPAKE